MPSPTILSYTVQDAYGVKGQHKAFCSYDADTETVAALLGAAAAYGGLIDAITGGKILQFNVKVNALPDPSWKGSAVSGQEIEQSLLSDFSIYDSKYVEPLVIPGLKASLIGADGRPITTSSGAIDNWIQAVLHSTGITGIAIQSQFLENLIALRDIGVCQRKHRKARQRVSRKYSE